MKNLIVGFTVIIVCASASFAQSFDWAFSAHGKGVAEGNAVCMDADGKCLWAIKSKKVIVAKGNGIDTNGKDTIITGMFLGGVINFDNYALKVIGSGNFFATRIN